MLHIKLNSRAYKNQSATDICSTPTLSLIQLLWTCIGNM